MRALCLPFATMRLRTTKVFVDSRYAVMGTSGSSILFEIPGGVEVGPNARCFVSEFTGVCVPGRPSTKRTDTRP